MGIIFDSRSAALFTRQTVEDEIERLIALLDVIDGDENLEPDCDDEDGGDDEPSISTGYYLGASGRMEEDLELDTSDDEPSLGWVTHANGRISMGQTWDCDLELEDCR